LIPHVEGQWAEETDGLSDLGVFTRTHCHTHLLTDAWLWSIATTLSPLEVEEPLGTSLAAANIALKIAGAREYTALVVAHRMDSQR
jgi:hypothetical protein